jgi:hypothetical protein
MRIPHLSSPLKRLATGLILPLMLAAGGMSIAVEAGTAGPAAADDVTVGDPPLDSYPGLPDDGTTAQYSAFAVTTTALPCGDNGSSLSPTRSTVLKRARTWLAVGIPYSQYRCYQNQNGVYRTDCSGYVSMAWGVGGRGDSHWTGNFLNISTVIARSSLLPGDALLRHVGNPHLDHVVLFVRWADDAHTQPVVMEQTGSRDTVEDTWSQSNAALYTPVRYNNIADDPTGPLPRIGVVSKAGAALVKEGGLSAAWDTEQPSGVQQVQVDGSRIGVLTTDGRVLVKDGALSAAWTTEYTGATQFALADGRIAVLTTAGVELVKEGGLSADWVTQLSGVQQISLDKDRIGALTTAGVAKVKAGGLSALWVNEYSGVQQLVLAGDRVGVLTTAGVALVKDGGLSANWTTENSGIQQIALADNRIGVITTAGAALVKDGGLSALWTTEQGSGVQQVALAGSRIGLVTTAGSAMVKDGGLSALWTTENSNIQQIGLS